MGNMLGEKIRMGRVMMMVTALEMMGMCSVMTVTRLITMRSIII